MSNRQDDALHIRKLKSELRMAVTRQCVAPGKANVALVDAADAALSAAIASLQARLDAAEADAARWRWFAGDCDGNGQDNLIQYLTRFVVSKAEIDAAVDAQMESE